jgi:hypothetical protein
MHLASNGRTQHANEYLGFEHGMQTGLGNRLEVEFMSQSEACAERALTLTSEGGACCLTACHGRQRQMSDSEGRDEDTGNFSFHTD